MDALSCSLRLFALALTATCASASNEPPAAPAPAARSAVDRTMPDLIERYRTDASALRSFYDISLSPTRRDRLAAFRDAWSTELDGVAFDLLDTAGRIDWVLLDEHLANEDRLARRRQQRLAAAEELMPFAATIIGLEEGRWSLEPVDPRGAADALDALVTSIEDTRARVEAGQEAEDEDESDEEEDDGPDDEDVTPLEVTAVDARRWAGAVDELRDTLATWHEHYAAYEPAFAWWTTEPYDRAHEALDDYATSLREDVAGLKGEDDDPLIGDPIGRDALLEDIAHEMLPYTPEQLIAIGEAQFAWCEEQMRIASNELGYGDDWQAALEHVKGLHVEPGLQDQLVVDQAREAIAFLEERDLVTVPELAAETWRLRMISKEEQRTLPFAAYGGQVMLVAYPTDDMDHESKLMAMRGNNIHFSRIVTPHELIPGHHLQGFMARRHNTHRRSFGTPFLGEGWALYWEMLLWDEGWPLSPEDRIGMLFWRMHRCARIVVSLGFHLERMEPDEMIDFLVERVGHERDNATAEVRRYIAGNYGPLYQCAYMIGGLQLRALHGELVGGGVMTDREFHDAVLKQNSIPIVMIRAALRDEPPGRDGPDPWTFAGDVKPSETFADEDEENERG